MKRLVFIFAFLLCCSAIQVQARGIMTMCGAGVPVAVTKYCTNESNDICIDFESNSDCTDGELEKTDNNASSQTYVLSDGSSKLSCASTDAEKVGSKGMSWAGGASSYIGIGDLSVSSVSGGMWFYAGAIDQWSYGSKLVEVRSSSYALCDFNYIREGGASPIIQAYISEADNVTVTAGNWYWVTWQVIQNSTCKMAVYDASGNEIAGSPTSQTGVPNQAITTVRWGQQNTLSATLYYDDIAVDWTDATFPLTAK